MPFTTPPVATNGSVIASAHVNLLGSNDVWFNGLLGTPTTPGQVPISAGTLTAVYGILGTASITNGAVGSVQLGGSVVGSVQFATGSVGTAAMGGSLSARVVPSGLGGWVRTAAEIPSGWTREGSLDGRIAVGAGTLFGGTFDPLTNYGSSWSHSHPVSTSGSAALATGSPSTTDANFSGGGASSAHPSHSHAVSTSTDAIAWTIPMRGYVAIKVD